LRRADHPEQAVLVAKRKWIDLSPRTRRLIVTVGLCEAVLKLAALIDLARRPASEVRGPKWRWALVIIATNSVGAVPIAYFARGRRRATAAKSYL
jgi:hypothetical protein